VFAADKFSQQWRSSSKAGKAGASPCFLIGRLTGNSGPAGGTQHCRVHTSRLSVQCGVFSHLPCSSDAAPFVDDGGTCDRAFCATSTPASSSRGGAGICAQSHRSSTRPAQLSCAAQLAWQQELSAARSSWALLTSWAGWPAPSPSPSPSPSPPPPPPPLTRFVRVDSTALAAAA
jgi:hypothetical protein